ncbi:hypothetical protein F4818DRAFT_399763 [Hypoxylon cercidicola]|nr:hypothetical protein F4818DRAFT_399763 [Hypoxylon cercidicola]
MALRYILKRGFGLALTYCVYMILHTSRPAGSTILEIGLNHLGTWHGNEVVWILRRLHLLNNDSCFISDFLRLTHPHHDPP